MDQPRKVAKPARGKYIYMYWYSIAVYIGLYTMYQYIFYLGTCTFVYGSLLLYNMHLCMCNYSDMCIM